ncbi:MAG: hypothetical protein Q8J78_12405 [Moraxellaceae bacterium]|nr:hypothetical protein [Moraxellaceae bacterium]
MKNPLNTRQELVYVMLIMVLPIAAAYFWQHDSVSGFVLVLGIRMATGFALFVALFRGTGPFHQSHTCQDP